MGTHTVSVLLLYDMSCIMHQIYASYRYIHVGSCESDMATFKSGS